jgi:hypothetical protein
MEHPEYKLPAEFPVTDYKCGLKAGDRVRLIRNIIIRDDYGLPTGKAFLSGEIWTVRPGARYETIVVWLRRADGNLHTWDDDESLFKTFEKLPSP